jgi:hypothetical protein
VRIPAIAQRRIQRVPIAALLPVLAAVQLSCFASSAIDAIKPQPTGAVHLASGTLGNRVLTPTTCASGERQLFLGADLVDSREGLTTRLILDPVGSVSIRVFNSSHPLDPGLLFQRHDCDQLELSLEHTGWRINEVYDLRLSIELACHLASGESLQGKLAADHCH